MRFTFLGTAAAEGFPDAFCGCENCENARRAGGPSLRKRSAALINDDLLLDFGPDLMAASEQHGVSLANVRFCLQTHEHADHMDAGHFISRSRYSGVDNVPRLHYYASREAIERGARILDIDEPYAHLLDETASERLNLDLHAVRPFESFRVGPYLATSLAANHAPETTAMLYLVERDGHAVFYGTDTGELPDETWAALERRGTRIDLLVMEHTFGFQDRSRGHMNWEQFVEQVDRFRALDLLAPDGRIFATHLGHHSHPIHPDLVAFAADHGYEIAYDGLVIDLWLR